MLQKIKDFLKRILPPPTRTVLRETEELKQLLAQLQAQQLAALEQQATVQGQLAFVQAQMELQAAQTTAARKHLENLLHSSRETLAENILAVQKAVAENGLDAQKRLQETAEVCHRQTAALQRALEDARSSGEKRHTDLQKQLEKFAQEAKRKDPFAGTPALPAETVPLRTAADPKDAVAPAGFGQVIPIVFATNDTYAPYAGVAIESILQNAGENNFYRIYVLHDGLSRYHREGLDQISSPNAQVQCIDVSGRIEALREHLYSYAHFSRETYFRFLIPEIFPFFEKMIYLDGDLVVRTDIAEILSEDMGDALLAGVHNLSVGRYAEQRKSLGLDLDAYVNAGVLVFHVKNWLKENTAEKCFQMLKATPKEDLLSLDQDILNKICAGRILLLPAAWNFCWNMVYGTEEQKALYAPTAEKFGRNFHVLHFASGLKPWDVPQTALSGCFWEYARTSCFYEEILSIGICK